MDSVDTFITKSEISQSRTADELITWLDKKFSDLRDMDGGKEAVRMRKGLYKQLVEEVYPLRIFAEHKYSGKSNILLEPVIGNQKYDALITDVSKDPLVKKKLEITQAHEGENEFLIRKMLHEQGHAPATGKIIKTGTKNTGINLQANSIAISSDVLLNQQIELIKEAFERKLKNTYEVGTSLLIMFEDSVTFRDEDSQQILLDFVENDLGPRADKFAELYLASWSKTLLITWTHEIEF